MKNHVISAETLAGLLTAPVDLEQALKLKEHYDRLTAPESPAAAESAHICDEVCRTLVDANPTELAKTDKAQMKNFRKWQLEGQRRKLIEAFRAGADRAETQAAASA